MKNMQKTLHSFSKVNAVLLRGENDKQWNVNGNKQKGISTATVITSVASLVMDLSETCSISLSGRKCPICPGEAVDNNVVNLLIGEYEGSDRKEQLIKYFGIIVQKDPERNNIEETDIEENSEEKDYFKYIYKMCYKENNKEKEKEKEEEEKKGKRGTFFTPDVCFPLHLYSQDTIDFVRYVFDLPNV